MRKKEKALPYRVKKLKQTNKQTRRTLKKVEVDGGHGADSGAGGVGVVLCRIAGN